MISNRKFILFHGFCCAIMLFLTSCTPTTLTAPVLGTYEFVPNSSQVALPFSIYAGTPSATSISLTWSSTSYANYFHIYRSTTSGGTYEQVGENNACSYVDTAVDPSTSYFYKIKALWRSSVTPSKFVEGSFSSWYQANTVLEAPQNVLATEDNLTQVTVTWQAVTGAASYKIYRALNTSSSYTLLSSGNTALSYNDTAATIGYVYKYQVSAVSSSAVEGVKSNYDTGYKCTNSPTNVAATDGLYYRTVKITWNAASNSPSCYQIYRSTNGVDFIYLTTTSTSATNYSDTDVLFGVTYSYKIQAKYAGEALSSLSASDIGYIRNPVDTVQYAVSWTRNRESAVNRAGGGYKLYYSQTSNFDINSATMVNLPYVSGPYSPASTTLTLTPALWYVKVVAYSAMNSYSSSVTSDEMQINIE